MSQTLDSAARCPEHDEQPTYKEQALEDQLTQEQCDEEEGGAEGRVGEAAEGKEEEDDEEDSEEGYVSPEDPFPRKARMRR